MLVELSQPIGLGDEVSSRLTLAVRGILTEEDVEGLMQAGAPPDEYEAEAALIAGRIARLPQVVDEVSVLEIVTEECLRSFGPFDSDQLARRRETYARIARRILMVLEPRNVQPGALGYLKE